MTDQFYLAMLSLGASTAAIVLALYLVRKEARLMLSGAKGPGEKVDHSPVTAPPIRSIGLELKKLVDKE